MKNREHTTLRAVSYKWVMRGVLYNTWPEAMVCSNTTRDAVTKVAINMKQQVLVEFFFFFFF